IAAAVTTVTVRNAVTQAYWAELTSPAQGAVVSGTVALAAAAGGSPVDDVAQVTFSSRAVGATAWYPIATDPARPWSASWATAPWVGDGAYELRVQAWVGGAVVASKIFGVTVRNSDTTAPAVAIVAPAAGAVVGGLVPITAAATDAGGISRVEFYSEGGDYLIATDTTAPYGIAWATDP